MEEDRAPTRGPDDWSRRPALDDAAPEETADGGDHGPPATAGGTRGLDEALKLVTFALAVVLVAGLFLFIVYLLRNVSANETQWQRYVYLLTGVEAIAFAAAGYLFGREVNRGVAVQAQQRADDEQKRADAAERGKADAQERAERHAVFATAYGKQLQAVRAKLGHLPERVFPDSAPARRSRAQGPGRHEGRVLRRADPDDAWEGFDIGEVPPRPERGRGEPEAEERGEKEGTHEGSESAERRARRARREEEPRAESSFRVEADLLRSEIAELAEIVDQPPLPPGVGRRDRWSEGI